MLEIKTLDRMKKGFNGLITRLNTSRKTDDFKDRSVEISQTEMQRKKKERELKKIGNNMQELWDT